MKFFEACWSAICWCWDSFKSLIETIYNTIKEIFTKEE